MINIDKLEAAARADTEDELQWSSTGILELTTRLREAEKDAARYRWLKGEHDGNDTGWHVRDGGDEIPDNLNEAIDKALNTKSQPY